MESDGKKIVEIRIDYQDWIKNPFPQSREFIVDNTTRYVVINCPPEYAKHLEKSGVRFEIKK